MQLEEAEEAEALVELVLLGRMQTLGGQAEVAEVVLAVQRQQLVLLQHQTDSHLYWDTLQATLEGKITCQQLQMNKMLEEAGELGLQEALLVHLRQEMAATEYIKLHGVAILLILPRSLDLHLLQWLI